MGWAKVGRPQHMLPVVVDMEDLGAKGFSMEAGLMVGLCMETKICLANWEVGVAIRVLARSLLEEALLVRNSGHSMLPDTCLVQICKGCAWICPDRYELLLMLSYLIVVLRMRILYVGYFIAFCVGPNNCFLALIRVYNSGSDHP